MSRPQLPAGELKCPTCSGTEFKHVENIEAIRNVIGYAADGTLEIESHYKVSDEVGEPDPRLWCYGCSTEYDVPEGIEFL